MEPDIDGLIGAGRHEHSTDRPNYRNGYHNRGLKTPLGTLSLRIPKLRQGSHLPPFPEPRNTAEKALVTAIQEAWISGVSTRRSTSWCRLGGSAATRRATCPSCARISLLGGAGLGVPAASAS